MWKIDQECRWVMNMKSRRQLLIIISLFTITVALASQKAFAVHKNSAEINFPETITFQLHASSTTEITSIHLEFGTDTLACGDSVSRAILDDFEPDTDIAAEWVWDLRRSGSLPPGTEVWWRWVLEDESGEIIETPVQRLIFLDDIFAWRKEVSDHISLYSYQGSEYFTTALLEAGEDALERLEDMTGVKVENQVKVYIYNSSLDMQEATLFAPDWSGGKAFPWNNAVIIGIAPSDLEWGKDTMAHELAHVIIGQYTFSCVDSTPGWIDEGLAMMTEGDLEPYYQDLLQVAVDSDELLSVREVGQIFSADPDIARLSYAKSFSLVAYLLETFDDAAILQLLDHFKLGESEDRSLEAVYGFDRDGLEVLWRNWLGAAPMQEAPAQGATPIATLFPTLAPIVGPNIQPSQTPAENIVDPPVDPMDESPGSTRDLNPVLLVSLICGSLLSILLLLYLRWRKSHKA